MKTTVNPGSWLELVGSFELVGEDEQFALDRESQRIVDLAELLKTFREDPTSPVVGTVRITIEPAPYDDDPDSDLKLLCLTCWIEKRTGQEYPATHTGMGPFCPLSRWGDPGDD